MSAAVADVVVVVVEEEADGEDDLLLHHHHRLGEAKEVDSPHTHDLAAGISAFSGAGELVGETDAAVAVECGGGGEDGGDGPWEWGFPCDGEASWWGWKSLGQQQMQQHH